MHNSRRYVIDCLFISQDFHPLRFAGWPDALFLTSMYFRGTRQVAQDNFTPGLLYIPINIPNLHAEYDTEDPANLVRPAFGR